MDTQGLTEGKHITDDGESQTVLDHALAYAARGIPVFPIHGVDDEGRCLCNGSEACNGGKNAGKHPATPRGLKDATTNPRMIRAWFERNPRRNIGMPTGEPSGIVVMDEDGAKGRESLRGRVLPETITVTSGRKGGGKHYWFRHPGSHVKSVASVLPGVDSRGDGGYVILPPSRHESGKRYAFGDPEGLNLDALAELSEWWLEAIRDKARKTANTFTAIIRDGERDTVLTSEAGTLRRRGAGESAILAYLRERNKDCETPKDDADLQRIAASVCRYDPESPLLTLPMTTAGDGERYAHVYRETSRYCPVHKAWYHYAEGIWKEDSTLQHEQQAKEVARLTQLAAVNIPTSDPTRAERLDYAVKMESAYVRTHMLTAARSEMAITPDRFDTHPNLINFTNGTLDLTTGEFRDFDPGDFLTRQTVARYDPSASSKEWLELVDWITDGNTELADYLQTAVGYSLTGYTGDEALFFAHGPAATGKSTFIEAVKRAFGTYAATADFETFLKRRHSGGGGAREDVARLNGPRFVASIEVEKGAKLAVGIVKALTGGDTIAARHLYKATGEFKPDMKLWLVANDAPEMEEDDSGLWRRVQKIPMEHVVPEGDRDAGLKLRLTNPELSGPAILAWAVEGALTWQAAGKDDAPDKDDAPGKLIVPEIVRNATIKLKESNDHIRQFIEDRCETGPTLREPLGQIRESYVAWCKEQKHEPEREKPFGQKLQAKGFTKVRGTGGTWYWQGLSFQSSGMADLAERYAKGREEQEQLVA